MNEPTPHAQDAGMAVRQQTPNRMQIQPGMVFVVGAVVTLFILPKYLSPPSDVMFMSFGSAVLLAVFVYVNPESFRSRGGSLVPAFCLVGVLWLLAVVSTVLSLID